MDFLPEPVVNHAKALVAHLTDLNTEDLIVALNEVRAALHDISPFKDEPVDSVLWIPSEEVQANDYNPNAVAPPEMQLLETSIREDGYTQPIVAWHNGEMYEVVDGFHRNRVGKESIDINGRVKDHLPLSIINVKKQDRSSRIASTIRHNRARGKHQVDAMSEIVIELKARNWKNSRISRELGMDEDEILRLCQITGLSDLFANEEFSKSWDVEDSEYDDFVPMDDRDGTETQEEYRHLNTDDPNRIFHTYDKWECAKAGFYKSTFEGKKREECEQMYADFLGGLEAFKAGLEGVTGEWQHSCEHYLTNSAMNRIAWLGQAAMCYATGVPAVFRGGWNLLDGEQQQAADDLALEYLNKWLEANKRTGVDAREAQNENKQTVLY